MTTYKQYTGTIIKRNGHSRTMSFIKGSDVPNHIKGSGKGPRLSSTEEVVYDVHAKGFRVFNWNTVEGDVSEKNIALSFDKS